MKFIKLLPVLAFLFLGSCDDQKKERGNMNDAQEVEVRDPSAANSQWIDAWNRNNPQELDTLTADDAMLYMEGEAMNKDSITAWYTNAAPMMKNLKTNPEVKYSNKEIAYEAGTYSHSIKADSLNTTYEGSYTLIWKRVENDWKLQVLNIAGRDELSSPDETEE